VNPFQVFRDGDDAFVAKITYMVQVAIDIKPNSINLGSGGNVPAAIFSTTTFDASTVVPMTVTLASALFKPKGNGMPVASSEDVDGDGPLDLVVHV